LLNSEQRQVATSVLAAELGVQPHEVADYLVTRVAPAYIQHKVYAGSKEELAMKVFNPDDEIIRLFELVHIHDSKCQSIKNLVINIMSKIVKSKTPEYRGILYRTVYEYSNIYLRHRKDRALIVNQRYAELVKLVAPAATLLDAMTPKEEERCNWIHDVCDDFRTEYEKTSRNKTLSSKDDSTMLALTKKWLEFGRSRAMTLL